jgi:hypothetical protein
MDSGGNTVSEHDTPATQLVAKIADKYREHNLNAIEVGQLVSELNTIHGLTLDQLRVELREHHGITIHSNGTLSKWRGVYETYVTKWGLTTTELAHHEISKLYAIKDVFEPSTADLWFERMNSMTEGELLTEMGAATQEGRKHYSLPLSVAGLVERARAALSVSATGSAGQLSGIAYQEIAAQLILDMGPERRREIYGLLHGEQPQPVE